MDILNKSIHDPDVIAFIEFGKELTHSCLGIFGSELYHHGVLGMRWGVRKDDRNSGHKDVRKDDKSTLKVTRGHKSELSYKLSKELRDNNLGKISRLLDLPFKTGEAFRASYNEDMKIVNKNYPMSNLLKGTSIGTWSNNCPSASMAYELRRRGYDAEAGLIGNDGSTVDELLGFFGVNVDYANFEEEMEKLAQADQAVTIPPATKDDSLSMFETWPDGARGIMMCAWKKGGGHICNVEIVNGKPVIVDAQSAKSVSFSESTISGPGSYLNNARVTYIVRVDDKNIYSGGNDLATYVRKRVD